LDPEFVNRAVASFLSSGEPEESLVISRVNRAGWVVADRKEVEDAAHPRITQAVLVFPEADGGVVIAVDIRDPSITLETLVDVRMRQTKNVYDLMFLLRDKSLIGAYVIQKITRESGGKWVQMTSRRFKK
jgi:hypothetical protein